MSKNPAWRLSAILESWTTEPNERLWDKRGPADKPTEYWHRQIDVVHLLAEVEQAISALELTGADVSPYREAFPDWCDSVFGAQLDWRSASQGQRRTLDPGNDRMLRALAGLLDAVPLPDEVDSDEILSITDALNAAAELVKNEPALSRAGRGYLLALIEQARYYLDHRDNFGASLVRRATHTVAGALHTAADSGVIPPERTPAWRKAAAAVAIAVVTPFAAALGEHAAGAVLPAGPSTVIEQHLELPPLPDAGHYDAGGAQR